MSCSKCVGGVCQRPNGSPKNGDQSVADFMARRGVSAYHCQDCGACGPKAISGVHGCSECGASDGFDWVEPFPASPSVSAPAGAKDSAKGEQKLPPSWPSRPLDPQPQNHSYLLYESTEQAIARHLKARYAPKGRRPKGG